MCNDMFTSFLCIFVSELWNLKLFVPLFFKVYIELFFYPCV